MKLFSSIINVLTIGTVGALIGWFAKWLLDLWKGRTLQKLKARHDRELELIKARHARDLETHRSLLNIAQDSLILHRRNQYDIYKSVWSLLHDIEQSACELWSHPDDRDLHHSFARKLETMEEKIESNKLFIEESHLRELKDIVAAFWLFGQGKKLLLLLREKAASDIYDSAKAKYENIHDLWNVDITRQMALNIETMERFTKLYDQIMDSFRKQMKGEEIADRKLIE